MPINDPEFYREVAPNIVDIDVSNKELLHLQATGVHLQQFEFPEV